MFPQPAELLLQGATARSVLKLIVGDTDSMSPSVGDELKKMPQ